VGAASGMKPVAYAYERPESLDEALALLAEHGADTKVLAGGQSLVPMLNMRLLRPARLIDINHVVGLENVARETEALRVGALVRQADRRLLELPLLADCLPHVGHFVTRNRGTVCGSVAHADPAAELPLALTVLGGSVVLASAGGRRTVAAADFFLTHFTTQLEPDELVVETVWPRQTDGWGYAFEELSQRRGDFALCMAAVAVRGDELRVGLGSVSERPRLVDVDPEQPGASAAGQVEPFANLHASAAYLRQLVRVLVDRAVARARSRAWEEGEETA
jgi:2-furoyl-CoA dehydrogenase FAD binding subunit